MNSLRNGLICNRAIFLYPPIKKSCLSMFNERKKESPPISPHAHTLILRTPLCPPPQEVWVCSYSSTTSVDFSAKL